MTQVVEKYATLYNGVKIPYLGLGTDYRFMMNDDYAYHLIERSILAGFRHIDTAYMYKSEAYIGNCIDKLIKQDVIKRNELFITSKVPFDIQGYNSTLEAFELTLKKLQTDYLDLYLIHYPLRDKLNWRNLTIDTWRALEKLYNEKRVRAIGVSNFLEQHLNFLLSKVEVKPMVNQIELTPYFQQRELVEYCRQNYILLESWGSLYGGELCKDETVIELSKKYSIAPSQIIYQWNKQKGFVALTKPCSFEEVVQNSPCSSNFVLNETDMDRLDSLDCGRFTHFHSDCEFLIPRNEYAGNYQPQFRPTQEIFKLFNFLPLFKIVKTKSTVTKYYFLNIPIAKKHIKSSLYKKPLSVKEYKKCRNSFELLLSDKGENFYECPYYDDKTNKAYCIGQSKHIIYQIDLKTKKIQKFKRKDYVGCFILKDSDILICAQDSGLYEINLKTKKDKLLYKLNISKDMHVNDGILDPMGRFLFGTMGEYNKGSLYAFDGKKCIELINYVGTSNGIAFSADKEYMYYIDSSLKRVSRYKYNKDGSVIFDKFVIFFEDGTPDGMCIDGEENLYIATYNGKKIVKFDKNYNKKDVIECPTTVTSIALSRGGGLTTTCTDSSTGVIGGLFKVSLK